MDRLRYIIDVDGFNVSDDPETEFLCKELGICNLRRKSSQLITFRLHRTFSSLTEVDKRQANFVKNHVHGLRFEDKEGDLDQKQLMEILKSLSEHCNDNNFAIGYKGGHLERNLLYRANARHVINIEKFGTPKFSLLSADANVREVVNTFDHFIVPTKERKCLQHGQRQRSHRTVYHCPMLEVSHFAAWLFLNNP